MTRRATSREVARAAGVSQALVSRVFTGNGTVAANTRERILKAADALGWQDNALAASMVTGDVPLVGVIAARLSFDWRAKVLSQVLSAFEASGVLPLLFYADTEQAAPQAMAESGRWRTRGVVVTAGEVPPDAAARLLRQGRFVVGLNRPVPAPGGYAIGTDNADAGAQASTLLERAGRRRLAVLAGPADSRAGADRTKGFLGQSPQASVWHSPAMDTADGNAAAARWLALDPQQRPEGVFAANDLLAIGFIDGLRDAGVRVPDDVSVVGFDNLPAASWAPYRLTSFAQPVQQMVDGALNHIRTHRENPSVPVPEGMILCPARPVLRDSVGPAGTEAGA